MRKLFPLVLLLLGIQHFSPVSAIDPDEMLRNLPAPEVNYPTEEIRVVTPPALMPALATEAVDHPPEKPPYEIRKLVEKIQDSGKSPVIRSTRKLLTNLTRKPPVKVNPPAALTASPAANLAASGTIATAIIRNTDRTGSAITATSTQIIANVSRLASNSAILELKQSYASNTALIGEIFALYLEQSEPIEAADSQEPAAGSYDAIFVTATGLQKKSQWQELKDLFVEHPEAGETPDGLRMQIQAEMNLEKPNYMVARRFADKLIESEKTDPLANYAVAMSFYNSKKPNMIKVQQALDIALKAKTPPEGASRLYWTIMLKKFAIPLVAVLAGLIAGVVQFIKKRKAAAMLSVTPEDQPEPSAPTATPDIIVAPSSGLAQRLKDKIATLMSRLKRNKNAGQPVDLDSLPPGSSPTTAAETANEIKENRADTVEAATAGDEGEEDEFALEEEDSAVLAEGEETDDEEGETEEASEIEEIEEVEEIEETEEVEEIIEVEEVEEVEEIEEVVEIEEVEELEEVEEIEEVVEIEESVEGGEDEEIEYEEVEVEEVEEVEDEEGPK